MLRLRGLLEHYPPIIQVWVKLVEMREDGGGNMKLGCSMKAVDQSTGTDLDPSNALLRWLPRVLHFNVTSVMMMHTCLMMGIRTGTLAICWGQTQEMLCLCGA